VTAGGRPLITLLTDFGTADGYVGEVKGALLDAAPDAELIDISHDIPANDIESGRLAVSRYWQRFPERTVHLVVIDPGVGGARAALAVSSAGRSLVGPDNGVLSPALLVPGAQAVTLPVASHAAATFHGRDVFAPAAAALARGAALSDLGLPASQPITRRTPEPERRPDGTVEGQVIAIDRFGNAITNCVGTPGDTIEVDGLVIEIARIYADVSPGSIVAVTGSNGLIEIAERDGNAARQLGLQRGSLVRLRRTESKKARLGG
jgi:S-adenosyl-L-methionine hydrolase (adenosine-forming)